MMKTITRKYLYLPEPIKTTLEDWYGKIEATVLYVNTEGHPVDTAHICVLLVGRDELDFVRIFKIGDEWNISADGIVKDLKNPENQHFYDRPSVEE